MWHICIEECEKNLNLLYIFNDLDELIFAGFFKEQRTHLCNLRQYSGQWQARSYASSFEFNPHELHQFIHHCLQRYLHNASKFSTAKQWELSICHPLKIISLISINSISKVLFSEIYWETQFGGSHFLCNDSTYSFVISNKL